MGTVKEKETRKKNMSYCYLHYLLPHSQKNLSSSPKNTLNKIIQSLNDRKTLENKANVNILVKYIITCTFHHQNSKFCHFIKALLDVIV